MQLRDKKWNRSRKGQVLVIAIILLGVLLILGFAFAALVASSIRGTFRSQQRSVATDLAEAVTRFGHYQLVYSEKGADWRPEPSPPPMDAQGYTKDPDALYTRLGTGYGMHDDADPVRDLGGPDGFGPFTRVNYEKGRGLLRVRYAPSDLAGYDPRWGSVLKHRGKAHNYVIIEAIGRPGRVNANDPTILFPEAVKVANYADSNEFRQQLGRLRLMDSRVIDSRRLIAFASIGIIESALFITNKDNVSRPAEIGVPVESGVRFMGRPLQIATRWGDPAISGIGSLWSNASLKVYGEHDVLLDPAIGDGWNVAGTVRGADDQARVNITLPGNPTPYSLSNAGQYSLDSNSNRFFTISGVFRDGAATVDPDGFARYVGRKEPPSFLRPDPATGLNRYLMMSRNSGRIVNGRNAGRYGYGRNVYIDSNERGNLGGDDAREIEGPIRSLPDDWLNPNNENSVAWQGPFYRPLATYIEFVPDGFVVTRDSRSRQRFWRAPDGSATNVSTVRYRLRRLNNGQVYILNSVEAPDVINLPANQLADQVFQTRGLPFGGVIFLEGDVRVRGVIPTHIQITLASMGTVYIEGSITKGVVREDGTLLGANQPSLSALMLMARDYIAINTTAFFAPGPGQDPQASNQDPQPNTPNPVYLDPQNPSISLRAQVLLNPDTPGALGANDWQPYALQYAEFGTNNPISPFMLLTHAADNGGPSFVGMQIAGLLFAGLPPAYSPYLWPRVRDFGAAGIANVNGASGYFLNGVNVPIYGLTQPGIHAYPKFEAFTAPFLQRGGWLYDPATRRINRANANEAPVDEPWSPAVQDETEFQLQLRALGNSATQNYYLARAAIAPHDIRIEAAMYAEEGSFFVIPGPYFNHNSADVRPQDPGNPNNYFPNYGNPQQRDFIRRSRYENFGAMPEAPFFAEPLDVRISIVGAVSQNMPAPIAQQAEWMRKWGWIPRYLGGTEQQIPDQHVPRDLANPSQPDPRYMTAQRPYVPNLILAYDPTLALGSADGVNPIRRDGIWVLPPMPRLPVSPTLAYFGEVNP